MNRRQTTTKNYHPKEHYLYAYCDYPQKYLTAQELYCYSKFGDRLGDIYR